MTHQQILTRIYQRVSRTADTPSTKISAADVNRVLACFFDELHACSSHHCLAILERGLHRASDRNAHSQASTTPRASSKTTKPATTAKRPRHP